MQRPAVIEQAELAARAGKIPIEIASGINLEALSSPGPISARPKSNQAESVARSGRVVSNAGTMMTPLEVEHAPAKLEVGSVWDGGILQRSVFLTSPTDGEVQVKV